MAVERRLRHAHFDGEGARGGREIAGEKETDAAPALVRRADDEVLLRNVAAREELLQAPLRPRRDELPERLRELAALLIQRCADVRRAERGEQRTAQRRDL